MNIIMTILLVAVVTLVLALPAVRGTARQTTAAPGTTITVNKVTSLTKAQLKEMLARIEKSTAPPEKMGAMCYDMAAPPERADYLCPKCGRKTVYVKSMAIMISQDLVSVRRMLLDVKKIAQLDISLDESALCKGCALQGADKALNLVITYAGGETYRAKNINPFDMRLLLAFFQGKLTYTESNDAERPLKRHLQRLGYLLGI